jgi:ABC-type uncharacterized transport system permease subunit
LNASLIGALRRNILLPALAIMFALVVGALVMSIAGYSPAKAYAALWESAFGSKSYFADTLIKTTPLLLTGLGVSFAFRASVFNIGAEGQLHIGALIVAWLGVALGNLPMVVLLPLVLLFGALGGGVWGAFAGWLKAKLDVSEVITTIMLNYIAIRLVGFCVHGPLKEQIGRFPQSDRIVEAARMPIILQGTRLHLGFVIAVVLAIILYYVLFRTPFGYEIRAVGLNPMAAKAQGVNVTNRIIMTMFLSGALAGLAGAVEMSAVSQRLYEQFSPGYGYDAIAVSLVAKNNPVGVVFSAFLFGVLRTGSNMMQRAANVSAVFVYVFQALVVFFVATFGSYGVEIAAFLRQKLIRNCEAKVAGGGIKDE